MAVSVPSVRAAAAAAGGRVVLAVLSTSRTVWPAGLVARLRTVGGAGEALPPPPPLPLRVTGAPPGRRVWLAMRRAVAVVGVRGKGWPAIMRGGGDAAAAAGWAITTVTPSGPTVVRSAGWAVCWAESGRPVAEFSRRTRCAEESGAGATLPTKRGGKLSGPALDTGTGPISWAGVGAGCGPRTEDSRCARSEFPAPWIIEFMMEPMLTAEVDVAFGGGGGGGGGGVVDVRKSGTVFSIIGAANGELVAAESS